jgi:hypothetical protein
LADLHFAEIGKLFDHIDGFDFLSDQNMLEYDFIIIDTDYLIKEIKGQPESWLSKRFNELEEFVTRKNMPIVFLCSCENSFYTLKDWSTTIYEFLNIDVIEERRSGKKIEVNSSSLFSEFLKVYFTELEYCIGYSKHPGTSIGNASARNLSIGFYTRDFVFLPTLGEDCGISDYEFLEDLYKVCKSVRNNEEPIKLPEWTNNYCLPGEQSEKQHLKTLEEKIAALEIEKDNTLKRLSNYLPLKQLWSATGNQLEDAAKLAFSELGFHLLPTEHGRDDIIMKWKDQIVVVEVKGQTKSAAEKNAAQLEKWAAMYKSDHDITPKALLLVNTYRERPLSDRTEASFPDQMLKYTIDRKHCLMTTTQLCNLLLYCRNNPDKQEETIENLISTIGIFEPFNKWSEYIELTQEQKPKNTSVKKGTIKIQNN